MKLKIVKDTNDVFAVMMPTDTSIAEVRGNHFNIVDKGKVVFSKDMGGSAKTRCDEYGKLSQYDDSAHALSMFEMAVNPSMSLEEAREMELSERELRRFIRDEGKLALIRGEAKMDDKFRKSGCSHIFKAYRIRSVVIPSDEMPSDFDPKTMKPRRKGRIGVVAYHCMTVCGV